MKIYENLRKSTKIDENLRKSTKINENRRKSQKIHENLRKSTKIYENLGKSVRKFIKRLIKGCENKGGAAAFGRRPSFTLRTLY